MAMGRFAIARDLHFGSLIAALGSYLQARAQRGRGWFRIEDIDPPRAKSPAPPLASCPRWKH